MKMHKILMGICACVSSVGVSDVFHYHNVLMGDRAMGLGGAFTAISDDASGLVYNPAGLAFSLSNDISGSANAFYKKSTEYKNIIGEEGFTENSAGSTAPFFGALQKVDSLAPGIAVGFGLFNRDSTLLVQDDNIQNVGQVGRFHRSVNSKAGTSGYGIAVAERLVSSFAMGVSLTFLTINELEQVYQDARTATKNDAGADVIQILTQGSRQELKASAIEIGLGFQWAITPRVSLGLNLKVPTMLSQNFITSQETTKLQTPPESTIWTVERSITDRYENDNPLGTWPSEYRLGAAWFALTELVLTMDVIHFTSAKGNVKLYNREAVTNIAMGAEYYITPPLPLRFGLFTNKDARPDIIEDGVTMNQSEKIDYVGGTLFLAWVQPNSQVSIGAIIQDGKGKAQKLQNSTIINDVVSKSTTAALSATHNF